MVSETEGTTKDLFRAGAKLNAASSDVNSVLVNMPNILTQSRDGRLNARYPSSRTLVSCPRSRAAKDGVRGSLRSRKSNGEATGIY